MNPYVNEDVMWQRLQDLQREAENRRLLGRSPAMLALARRLGRRIWSLTAWPTRGRAAGVG